jgi:hypothetical protein
MLELLLGKIRTKAESPRNKRILKRYIDITHDYLHIGPRRFAKKYSTLARDSAIPETGPFPLRATKRAYLFVASTISRATHCPPPKRNEIEEEVASCIERITTKTPLPSQAMLDALSKYVQGCFKGAFPDTRIPCPSESACVELSRARGGCFAAIDAEFGQPHINSVTLADKTYRHMVPFFDVASVTDRYLELVLPSDDGRPLSQAYRDAIRPSRVEMFKEVLRVVPHRNRCKILPIVEMTGKIRIATLHSASAMWVARTINNILLPYLKRFSVTRSILRDQKKIYLRNFDSEEKIIYSADLSKSTDPMSIELVRHIFQAVQVAIPGLPDWFAPAVESVLGKQTLEHEGRTYDIACGALMGMGPGWTALCLLNAFCAESAGAPNGSFKVCGDDLVGLWNRDVCNRYENNLRTFGLVPNESKSFRAKNAGVFCERLVGRTGAHHATILPLVRLGEASGFRAYGTEKGKLGFDRLNKARVIKPIRWLVRKTLKTNALSPQAKGGYSQAGGGTLPPDLLNVITYFIRGATKLMDEDPSDRELTERLREIPLAQSGVPMSSALAVIRRLQHDRIRRNNRKRIGKPTLRQFSRLQKTYELRRHNAQTLLKRHKSLHQVLLAQLERRECIVPKEHPRQQQFIRRILQCCRYKHYGSAINAIKDWVNTAVVPIDYTISLIRSFHPEWEHPVTCHFQPAPGVWEIKLRS